ncbi:MAG TPA: hypothetical protein EYH48_00230 [Aquifex aeolicus]|uniref:Uncharacterized protein n=1 Tax=Aquifex aeolicus TaxID=63363 RepID=A0A9D1CEN1_AQUAO|nr:hypothetical protein [Aquificales bacterium]HIP97749.1 hypothetical protein [Aquifex aeolicus]HIQ25750.1 hypothetical protein [Aquifex aeolicus]
MRKFLALVSFIPTLVFSMGQRPVAEYMHTVKIVDSRGEEHILKFLSCDGNDYFEFEDGSLLVKVPFNIVQKVEVVSSEGEKLKVRVYFRGGKEREFSTEGDILCKGISDYGYIEAYLKQIKEIIFLK